MATKTVVSGRATSSLGHGLTPRSPSPLPLSLLISFWLNPPSYPLPSSLFSAKALLPSVSKGSFYFSFIFIFFTFLVIELVVRPSIHIDIYTIMFPDTVLLLCLLLCFVQYTFFLLSFILSFSTEMSHIYLRFTYYIRTALRC